jgi:hypothetical protein
MLSEKLIGKNLMYKKLMGKKTLKLRGRHMITPKRINAYDYPYNFYPHAQKILTHKRKNIYPWFVLNIYAELNIFELKR